MSRRSFGHGLVAAALLQLGLAMPDLAEAQGSTAFAHEEHGDLILEGVPSLDTPLSATLERYLSSREATFLDWLPDGTLLVRTRFGDAAQVHRVATPLGMREQLTYSPEPVSVAVAPQTGAATGFAFLKDQRGDENAQIYYYRLSDHSTRLLTDGKSRHGNPVWSKDGKHLAFFGNERDGMSYDIYVADIDGNTPPRLVVGGQQGEWFPLDWSQDDQKLLLMKRISITESYLYLAEVASGSLTAVDPANRKIGIKTARFAPDGRGAYVVSDESGEFAELRYLDLTTHESRELTANVPWDIDDFDVSVDGRYLAYVANDDGRSRLTVLDNLQKLELSPPGLPQGQITTLKFDRTGRKLALSAESAQSPRDIYVFDVEQNALTRWTRSELGPIGADDFVAEKVVHYPTWDRAAGGPRTLTAYVFSPRSPGPHPVIIDIHGGPEEQYKPHFDPFVQFLVNELGCVVIAPNVRGSSGYGKTFLKLDDGRLREDAVKDIGSLLVWIGVQPQLDRNRVVVMGGSYGGYMALASLAAYNDRLRAGIDVVGISNFVSFLEHTSPYRRDLRRVEYGDERDPDMRAFLNRISPLTNANAIRRPLLVVQGLNDPRVPAAESTQMVTRVRAHGGEVWYLAAKDEGHGFRRKSNRDAHYRVAAAFLQHVLGIPAKGP
jgi:dipeptidyl aminopeptidase/acylaminoacyl peptidase